MLHQNRFAFGVEEGGGWRGGGEMEDAFARSEEERPLPFLREKRLPLEFLAEEKFEESSPVDAFREPRTRKSSRHLSANHRTMEQKWLAAFPTSNPSIPQELDG
ncbi:hypothetical protein CDAR_589231 [Caerostris darwini]|uniref:Uncharacterized protein n=1 Tax=Caerostris darwini TaxID=1538125 RepID=A0AAV4T9Z6_9ARAC|nr:hypothetical protein CDAR_589231 [Caerostris darwini]